MKKYGEFVLIDHLATKYNYTHQDAFELSWRTAYTIAALGREQAYVESVATEMKRKADQNA